MTQAAMRWGRDNGCGSLVFGSLLENIRVQRDFFAAVEVSRLLQSLGQWLTIFDFLAVCIADSICVYISTAYLWHISLKIFWLLLINSLKAWLNANTNTRCSNETVILQHSFIGSTAWLYWWYLLDSCNLWKLLPSISYRPVNANCVYLLDFGIFVFVGWQVAAGSQLFNLLVDNHSTAASVIGHIKENRLGGTTITPLSDLRYGCVSAASNW